VSERRACRLLNFSRTSRRYQSTADEQALLRLRIRDLAYARVSYGYRRIHVLLRREGWDINHKRVYRLYREQGLSMRPKKPRRRVSCKRRVERVEATGPNEGWSMDFMHDELFDGRRFRLLTLVDNFSRESLAIEVGQSLKGSDVVRVLEKLSKTRQLARSIRVDNGAEFTSKILDQWAYLNGVELDFIRPGKPTENGLIESFNGRVREECLNENWFLSIDDAREKIEAWRTHYNHDRPHRALGALSPVEFMENLKSPETAIIP